MTSITSSDISEEKNMAPNQGKTEQLYKVTADSGDTIDVSDSDVVDNTLTSIDWVDAYDQDDGDHPSVTWTDTTITIDSGGGSSGNTYVLRVVGSK